MMKINIENLIEVPEIRHGSCEGCIFTNNKGECSADKNVKDCGKTRTIFISEDSLGEYRAMLSAIEKFIGSSGEEKNEN